MTTIDLRSETKGLYRPSAKAVSEVDVPPLNDLMIDGESDPKVAPQFAAAVAALFAVPYTLKFMLTKGSPAIAASGRQPRGKHHEIYLSDIRRAGPARGKTVRRQPMQ